MYEHVTYEGLLKAMIAVAQEQNANLDTREGSVLWYGLAPAAVELQNLYIQLDAVLNETFADTASRPYLIKRAAERGIHPDAATKAICRGEFTPAALDVAIGSRFSLGTVNFMVADRVEPGIYLLECEETGEIGNEQVGRLLPVQYIDGLQSAHLTEVLIPGQDEEDTESLRAKYFASLDAQAFGGNVADYREKVKALDGVGGVKVYRAWNGDIRPVDFIPPAELDSFLDGAVIPEAVRAWIDATAAAARRGLLTVGGTVRLVIIASNFQRPTDLLVDAVQTAIDPEQNRGEGLGLAPIGHAVFVEPVEAFELNIAANLTYRAEWSWEDVRHYAEEAIDAYFDELAREWEGSDSPLIVRISQIETRLLACPGVLDVGGTTLNGEAQNAILPVDAIPVRGDLHD